MMYYRKSIIGLLGLIISPVLLTGCASESELEYEALRTSYEDLQADYASLVSQNDRIEAEIESVHLKLLSVRDGYDELGSNHAALQADYTALGVDYESVIEELDEIKGVYPPRYFSSGTELLGWLVEDDISDRTSDNPVDLYQSALELQERALGDGYIINAYITTVGTTPAYYRIYCSALTEEDSLYTWSVEEDDATVWLADVKDFNWAAGF
ncbi:hypothetical protein ACFLW3_01110 [Chloroflexota bacterium]